LVIAVLLAGASVVHAGEGSQQDDICTPDYINRQMASLLEPWIEDATSPNQTGEEALARLEELNGEIQALIDLCSNVATADERHPDDPGSGTLSDPYAYGYAGDTGEGFSLRVTNTIRPADQIILRENMFNDRPQAGQQYVIVELELLCHESNTGRCESNYLDYELTGDSGTIYESAWVVYSNDFDVSTFGGGSGSGGIVFMIRSDDTNLRLLYKENMFLDDFVVYEAEPSLDGGIPIQSSANVNIRSQPNTSSAVVGSLPAGQPVIAIGRNNDGTWLKVPQGWVFAELVTASGDTDSLPVMSSN